MSSVKYLTEKKYNMRNIWHNNIIDNVNFNRSYRQKHNCFILQLEILIYLNESNYFNNSILFLISVMKIQIHFNYYSIVVLYKMMLNDSV